MIDVMDEGYNKKREIERGKKVLDGCWKYVGVQKSSIIQRCTVPCL